MAGVLNEKPTKLSEKFSVQPKFYRQNSDATQIRIVMRKTEFCRFFKKPTKPIEPP
jgi:hypothetical protein